MQAKGEELDETTPLPEHKRPGPDRLAESAEIDRLVNEALDELTAIERAAFTLRHHEGRSIEEICRTLNLGKSAAKHAVFRAVRKLRAALAPFRLAADSRMPS
jgi:RNA polymerase sigma-70 factor (ECF subfamily)